ncbi:MAG: tandem-95 repeat protein [Magnetococcales bacterium]|nr:tandem-95 repeat protein [Magnetococcales bacterium]
MRKSVLSIPSALVLLFTAMVLPAHAAAPVVASPIPNQTWTGSGSKSFQIPANTFTDSDGDTLRYSATLADGARLPAWLRFNATSRTFSGNPPVISAPLSIKVTANDGHYGKASATFTLAFTTTNDNARVATLLPNRTWSGSGSKSFRIPKNAFLDGDSDPLILSATLDGGDPLPGWLKFSPALRTFFGNPPAGLSQVNVRVNVRDGQGSTVSTPLRIFLTNVNDTPTVTAPIANQSWSGSGAKRFQVPASTFADADGDTLVWSATLADGSDLPAWLSFAPSTRTFSGNPPANTAQLDLKVTVGDGQGGSVSSTFTLSFSSNNDTPVVANPLTAQLWSGSGSKNFQVPAATFTDADGDALTYSAALADGSALPGWLTFNASTRTFAGNPSANTQPLNLRVTARDGQNASASSTFALSFSNANDTPVVANPLTTQVWSGSGNKSFQVPATTFSDADRDTLTLSATLSDGSALPSWLSFTPATRTFAGNPPATPAPLSLKVTARDGEGASVNTTFSLSFSNTNDPPTIIASIDNQTWSGDGSKSFQVPASIFTSIDNNSLIWSATRANGSSLPAWLSFEPSTRTFSGNPPPNVSSLSLKVTVSDGRGGSVSSSPFTLSFSNANDTPVAVDDTLTTNEIAAISDTLTATDSDGDALTYTIVTNGAKGTASITNVTTGAFTYTPRYGMTGTDSFTFKVNDGRDDSNVATVTINIVDMPNVAPVAANGTLTLREGTTKSSTLNATDANQDPLTYSLVANGSLGTVTINSTTGAYSYTSTSAGTDTFTFKVNDGTADSNTASVTVTISPMARTIRTGQTVSYATGDDGDLQKGVAWPDPRFTDNNNGTVTDNLTGLVWMKNANCWGRMDWSSALIKITGLNAGTQTCTGYTAGTYSDWRLPNLNELQSLIDFSFSYPVLTASHPFSGVQSSSYWSATTLADNAIQSWLVYLFDGRVDFDFKTGMYHVWPVQGGDW